jgi:hypothetical protein
MGKFLLMMFLMLVSVAASAAIYKWVDEKGVTHYSETPPSKGKTQELELQPVPPSAGTQPAGPDAGNLRKREEEFQKRREIRRRAEAEEKARRVEEASERQSNCQRARDELARLMATKPRLMGRDLVPLVDPQTGKEVETMNNAERSLGIEKAEEEIKKWCQ